MHEIVIAGFGGQGVLFLGKMLALAGMAAGKEISWLPSYGPEMRGGTANCHVIISDDPVASPMVTKPDVLAALNGPSLDKFQDKVKEGGVIIYDSSLISSVEKRSDIDYIAIDATLIADQLGAPKLANMVMAGKLVSKTGMLDYETLEQVAIQSVPASKPGLAEKNVTALRAGRDAGE